MRYSAEASNVSEGEVNFVSSVLSLQRLAVKLEYAYAVTGTLSQKRNQHGHHSNI